MASMQPGPSSTVGKQQARYAWRRARGGTVGPVQAPLRERRRLDGPKGCCPVPARSRASSRPAGFSPPRSPSSKCGWGCGPNSPTGLVGSSPRTRSTWRKAPGMHGNSTCGQPDAAITGHWIYHPLQRRRSKTRAYYGPSEKVTAGRISVHFSGPSRRRWRAGNRRCEPSTGALRPIERSRAGRQWPHHAAVAARAACDGRGPSRPTAPPPSAPTPAPGASRPARWAP